MLVDQSGLGKLEVEDRQKATSFKQNKKITKIPIKGTTMFILVWLRKNLN